MHLPAGSGRAESPTFHRLPGFSSRALCQGFASVPGSWESAPPGPGRAQERVALSSVSPELRGIRERFEESRDRTGVSQGEGDQRWPLLQPPPFSFLQTAPGSEAHPEPPEGTAPRIPSGMRALLHGGAVLGVPGADSPRCCSGMLGLGVSDPGLEGFAPRGKRSVAGWSFSQPGIACRLFAFLTQLRVPGCG